MTFIIPFKYFIFISLLIITVSCETTDVEEKVIKPEPVPKIIYTPEVEETVEENEEIVEHFKDIELFLNKPLNDLILKYGKADFSKIEKIDNNKFLEAKELLENFIAENPEDVKGICMYLLLFCFK